MSLSCGGEDDPERLEGLDYLARRIAGGSADDEEIREMLVGFNRMGISGPELLTLALAFQEASVPATTSFPVVADLCGTGGGRVRTFNISTAASFVVAGCGVPVAKHGNRSNAGSSGSADVLEALGARLDMGRERPQRLLDRLGYSFFYAPVFNPAMRHAAAARREIGGRSVLNLLGPLLNPVRSRRRQLIGVADESLLEFLPPVLEGLGIERAMLVHGSPGMDEASTSGPTEAVLVKEGGWERITISAEELGLGEAAPQALAERSPLSSAILVREILHCGRPKEAKEVVLLNAACALVAFGRACDLPQGLRLAEGSLDSGRAAQRLERFVSLSRERRAELP